MKKLTLISALAAALAVQAADTDNGALITTGTIEDTAKVENLTGANAGKATITINNNSGTAQAVTVYNSATVDSALSGKATTSSVTALEGRASALETATNNLTSAKVDKVPTANVGHFAWFTEDGGIADSGADPTYYAPLSALSDYVLVTTLTGSTNALWTAIPAWARASTKPSYNFSEIGSKPTTLSGYGITDAKIANGTITLGSNTITPLTSYTETDPVWDAAKSSYSTTTQMNAAITAATNGLAKASALSGYVPTSRKVAGKALTADVTLSNLSIVGTSTTTYNGSATASVNQTTLTETSTTQGGTTGMNLTLAVAATSRSLGEYYIKIGTDGKPHLMLRQ